MKKPPKKAPSPMPGNGLPADRAGLYWVTWPDYGRMIARCEGVAPFLRILIIDIWDEAPPRLQPTPKQIESLVWRGEILKPEVWR